MKLHRALWLILMVLLLAGCVAESTGPIEETPEYQQGYEQAQEDMEAEAMQDPPRAWDVFPEEMEQAREDGYQEGYIQGYRDAEEGIEPEIDLS